MLDVEYVSGLAYTVTEVSQDSTSSAEVDSTRACRQVYMLDVEYALSMRWVHKPGDL